MKLRLDLVKKVTVSQTPDSSSKIHRKSVDTKTLILLNDDYNTIDHVIDCLEAICDHSSLQAEQCAVITHYQGQCAIKKGLIEELEFFRQDLSLYGLNVEIL